MKEALLTLLPLYLFMLVPVWIPIVAILLGKVVEKVTFSREDVKVRPVANRTRTTTLAPAHPRLAAGEQLAA